MTNTLAQLEIVPLNDNSCVIHLSGSWHKEFIPVGGFAQIQGSKLKSFENIEIQLQDVLECDTFGALTLKRILEPLKTQETSVRFTGLSAFEPLFARVALSEKFPPSSIEPGVKLSDVPEAIGRVMNDVNKDVWQGIDVLGSFLRSTLECCKDLRKMRSAPFIFQLDRVAVQGLPIVVLMSAIVGAIVAQQGIFQLEKFGASVFAIDLLGILIFRELGVLLTAIMVAGRSGSAFTAELGSMKMNEEIDALRVLGLDPVKTLVMPRLFALIIGLPLLNIASALAALAGGALVCFVYGDVSFALFFERLREAVALNTFLVGMIKAPFLALVIGIIAIVEGLSVQGSSESLGAHTTASVVKAIFSVIVIDGLFAMFFAAIKY